MVLPFLYGKYMELLLSPLKKHAIINAYLIGFNRWSFLIVKRGADMDSALTTGRYEVKMFGGFSIRKGDVFVSKDQSRTKKVWILL